MTKDEAFIEDIIANPGEWTSSLVYADYLQEQGKYDLEFAYRWAVFNKKIPEPPGPHKWWQWLYVTDGEHKVTCYVLPCELAHTIMAQGRWGHTRHDSYAEAMEALAAGLESLKDVLKID